MNCSTQACTAIKRRSHIASLLLIAVVGAYVPQISQLRNLPSTHGIAPNYILFQAITSNTQLSSALILHAYVWPSVRSLTAKDPAFEQIARGRLKGLAAYGAVLGLLQVFAQWCCSISLRVARIPSHVTSQRPDELLAVSSRTALAQRMASRTASAYRYRPSFTLQSSSCRQ